MSSKSKQSQPKKQKAPPELTLAEQEAINECWLLVGWEFDAVIKPHCILIQTFHIGLDDSPGKNETVWAYLYGLQGLRGEKKELFCACFFLRVGGRTWQFLNVGDAVKMAGLLEKEFEFDLYQDKQEAAIHAEVTGKELT